jgi:rubredoxin
MPHEQINQNLLCTRCGHGCTSICGCPEDAMSDVPSEAVPSDWRCPGCGASRSCLASYEIIYQCAFFALTRL